MKRLILFSILLSLVLLPACSSTGSTTTPIATQAASNIGGDQGQAQATETNAATNEVQPRNYNLIGVSGKITSNPDGTDVIEFESTGGAVNLTGANLGQQYGDDAIQADADTGGGSAGGTGGSSRTATSSPRAGGNVSGN